MVPGSRSNNTIYQAYADDSATVPVALHPYVVIAPGVKGQTSASDFREPLLRGRRRFFR
jgi:hypothetical protein